MEAAINSQIGEMGAIMGSLRSAQERLTSSWSLLRQKWETAQSKWKDDAQRRFARESWPDYEQIPPQVISEIGNLDQVISRARREVN